MQTTRDLRIAGSHSLVTPQTLYQQYPLDEADGAFINQSRTELEQILSGKDPRLLCIVGPCSVHDPVALLEFAERFKAGTEGLKDALLPVLRVYFEKPRSVMGWKGLINDPDLDGSFKISKGLGMARELLVQVAAMRLPAATEFLDTTFGQYFADLISFGAIGARTVESQVHRELASGLSMPVGFKNTTYGHIDVAIDAIRSAAHPHWFPSLTPDGAPAILESTGNPYACLILRGGKDTGPNYSAEHVNAAAAALQQHKLSPGMVIDMSHGNSEKQHSRQAAVGQDIAAQIRSGQSAISGIMMESHLVAGNQSIDAKPRVYGQSITDACLAWDDTLPVLNELADAIRDSRL